MLATNKKKQQQQQHSTPALTSRLNIFNRLKNSCKKKQYFCQFFLKLMKELTLRWPIPRGYKAAISTFDCKILIAQQIIRIVRENFQAANFARKSLIRFELS
jgi:hypothetical protein